MIRKDCLSSDYKIVSGLKRTAVIREPLVTDFKRRDVIDTQWGVNLNLYCLFVSFNLDDYSPGIMDVFEAIETRRAIKKFDSTFKMNSDDVKKLMNHVILAPTSYNQQNWRFVYVTEQSVKEKISIAARGQAQPKDGSLVIILCGDMTSWKTEPLRYWKNHPTEKQEMVKAALERKYSDNPQNQRDEAVRSCGMAAQTIMLAAKQMGLDSCPMVGFEYDELAELIKLPENHLIVMMVVVGKRAEDAGVRGGQLSLDKVAFENSF